MSDTRDRFRVFQIGFNRCGTVSFAYFFRKNGFQTAHWRKGTVAAAIELARREGRPLLTYTDKFDVYTDMELVEIEAISRQRWPRKIFRRLLDAIGEGEELRPIYAYKHFALLDEQYPNSKFILNTRDRERWVRSRFRFSKQRYRHCPHGAHFHETDERLAECWRADWDAHLAAVRAYFADRPQDLLQFDIERDDVDKILAFFPMLDLDARHWQRRNASVKPR